jgi:hypothetical protein
MPYNPHAYNQAGLIRSVQTNYGFANVNSIENTDPITVTVPENPSNKLDYLENPPPNADDTSRQIQAITSNPVIQSNSSNLISCPNADGDVSLGCWLFSSENDRFMRKNLEVDAMPAEKQPSDIMVVPGNWMDLAGTTASPGNYSTVTPELYNTEILDSEQRIFTGLMMNSNTGQLYETYEDDVPPPDTDKKRLLPEQMSNQNPIVTALSGGWDPSMPTRHKVEVLEVEYGQDAGRNIWGPQLYATAIRDLAEQRDVRQQFNNRNGFVPIEPAWDRRAVGFVGHVSAYRGTPHMPPTQREARSNPDTFHTMVSNIDSVIDEPGIRGVQTLGPGNREAHGIISNESMSSTNLVPGRFEYRQGNDAISNFSKKCTGIGASQIYPDGETQLREEPPLINYNRAPDNTVVHTILRTDKEQRSIGRDDSKFVENHTRVVALDLNLHNRSTPIAATILKKDKEGGYLSQGDLSSGNQIRQDNVARRTIRSDPENEYYRAAETATGNQIRQDNVARRTIRSDAENQYYRAAETATGNQIRQDNVARKANRSDAEEQYYRAAETASGNQIRQDNVARKTNRSDAEEQYYRAAETASGNQTRQDNVARKPFRQDKTNGFNVRTMDELNANKPAYGETSSRLAREPQSVTRTQGFKGVDGSATLPDWTSHVRDTSRINDYSGAISGQLQGDNFENLRRAHPTRNKFENLQKNRKNGPNSVSGSTLSGSAYLLSDSDLFQIVGTRNPMRGLEQVNRELTMNYSY